VARQTDERCLARVNGYDTTIRMREQGATT
jgi:hypothetical protein